MQPLTKRQAEILAFLRDYIGVRGYAPSYREIGDHFKLSSTATVAEHIEALKSKGHLSHEDNLARSIQVTGVTPAPAEESAWVSIPLLGSIAAGKPIEAVATQETIDIPKDMMGRNVFALRVKGQSMVEDGILNGDYVICDQVSTAANGDIVVAMVDGDNVTLKRFYKEKDRVRLQPANSEMRPMYFKNVEIQGKVRGLIRKFV